MLVIILRPPTYPPFNCSLLNDNVLHLLAICRICIIKFNRKRRNSLIMLADINISAIKHFKAHCEINDLEIYIVLIFISTRRDQISFSIASVT